MTGGDHGVTQAFHQDQGCICRTNWFVVSITLVPPCGGYAVCHLLQHVQAAAFASSAFRVSRCSALSDGLCWISPCTAWLALMIDHLSMIRLHTRMCNRASRAAISSAYWPQQDPTEPKSARAELHIANAEHLGMSTPSRSCIGGL